MIIREATDADIPAIIELMRSSLGESLLPKSEQLWRWKHEQNPFGKSFVCVAEEDGILIGLRAFMQWQWQTPSGTRQAIRAVDTATHPNFQGKGIFKKLTLHQLEQCKLAGIHFVFNTPNTQSMPGYLKMGWQLQGRMPLKIKLHKPLAIGWNKMFNKNKFTGVSADPTPAIDWHPLLANLPAKFPIPPGVHTVLSAAYIQWRYANNPLYKYVYFTDGKTYIAIGRSKLQGYVKEFRITEYLPLQANVNTKHFIKKLHQFTQQHGIDFTSISGNQYQQLGKQMGGLGWLPVKPLGPQVTLRDIQIPTEMPMLMDATNWSYTLGDMELF